MARSIFGWSYPPGCSGPPEYDYPCDICGQPADSGCVCPECPVCGEIGDPSCYPTHGLVRTEEQRFLAEQARRDEDRFRKMEDAMFDDLEEDWVTD